LRENLRIGGPLVRGIVGDQKQGDFRRPVNGPALAAREHPRGMDAEEEMLTIGNNAKVLPCRRVHGDTGVRRPLQIGERRRQDLLCAAALGCEKQDSTYSRDETTPRTNGMTDGVALSKALSRDGERSERAQETRSIDSKSFSTGAPEFLRGHLPGNTAAKDADVAVESARTARQDPTTDWKHRGGHDRSRCLADEDTLQRSCYTV
jgi:hypothetical protein